MNDDGALTFWEHLDVLRGSIIRMLAAAVVAGVVAFVFKDWLFGVVLAPADGGFVTYRLLGIEPFTINLINTGLTEQFMIHMKMALVAGVLIASPYILYVLFRFISPALYDNERLPLTVRFLGTYSVSVDVENMLTISSYVDTLTMMSLVFGIVFEIPVISWLLARFGLLKAEWMSRYRRHAVVAIVVVAAIITPTSDVFTLLIVSLPIWLLYEFSVVIVKHTYPKPLPKGRALK